MFTKQDRALWAAFVTDPPIVATTLAVGMLAVSACQSAVGWKAVTSAVGVVPSAIWHPSLWCSTLPGQSLPVALTWVTYAFPHDHWMHVGTNSIGLFGLGGALERTIGKFSFSLLCLVATVAGAFILALISPHDGVAIGGGSLLMSPILGIFFATALRPKWELHPAATLTAEMALIGALALWLIFRTIPATRDAVQSTLWHAIPIFMGWASYRWTHNRLNWSPQAE